MENTNNKEIKNVCLWGESPVVNHVFANHRNSVNFSTNSMFTSGRMCNIIETSGGNVLLGRQFAGNDGGYNHNIFKAFKSLLKSSYGPVLPASWRGHQLIAGGVV